MNQTVPPSHERLDLLQYIFNGITAEYKNKLQEKREKVSESKDGYRSCLAMIQFSAIETTLQIFLFIF